jgi:hypothetical protein
MTKALKMTKVAGAARKYSAISQMARRIAAVSEKLVDGTRRSADCQVWHLNGGLVLRTSMNKLIALTALVILGSTTNASDKSRHVLSRFGRQHDVMEARKRSG